MNAAAPALPVARSQAYKNRCCQQEVVCAQPHVLCLLSWNGRCTWWRWRSKSNCLATCVSNSTVVSAPVDCCDEAPAGTKSRTLHHLMVNVSMNTATPDDTIFTYAVETRRSVLNECFRRGTIADCASSKWEQHQAKGQTQNLPGHHKV